MPRQFRWLTVDEKKVVILRSLVREDCVIHKCSKVEESMLRLNFGNLIIDQSVHFEIVADNFSRPELYMKVWTAVQRLRLLFSLWLLSDCR